MKKSILLFLLTSICVCGLQAQPVQMRLIGMSLDDQPTKECYTMSFEYICAIGDCEVSISNDIETVEINSGSPNSNWLPFSGTVCFDRARATYVGKFICKVSKSGVLTAKNQSVRDGCVVVIEGGG